MDKLDNANTVGEGAYPYVWRVRTRLPERFGQACRMLVRARTMNSCLLEFEDGYRVVTSRNYIRRTKKGLQGC
jgi:hypothetical protein